MTREVLWNGNREGLVKSLLTRDSVLWWAITTFDRRRATYARLAADPGSPPIVRLRSPREVARWLDEEARSVRPAEGRAAPP